jgi:hypothetical protein
MYDPEDASLEDSPLLESVRPNLLPSLSPRFAEEVFPPTEDFWDYRSSRDEILVDLSYDDKVVGIGSPEGKAHSP